MAPAPALDFGLSDGHTSLDLGGTAPSAERCGECHVDEYEQWLGSRHRASWSNDLMVAGYAVEPLSVCVNCHAPLPEQAAEIRANGLWYRSLDPDSRVPAGSITRLPEPQAEQGITCAVCHWRDGQVLAPIETGTAEHRVTATDALGTSELCVQCHEFGVPETAGGVTVLREELMQSTASEWRTWRSNGGTSSCEDCHMPGGRHSFRGVHDRQWLSDSITLTVDSDAGEVVFGLSSVGVGHNLPSGDLYRHLTLEGSSTCAQGSYEVIERIGRVFETRWDTDGHAHKTCVEDTSLRPGEEHTIAVPADEVACWRLVWHDASELDETRGILDPAAITYVLREGRR